MMALARRLERRLPRGVPPGRDQRGDEPRPLRRRGRRRPHPPAPGAALDRRHELHDRGLGHARHPGGAGAGVPAPAAVLRPMRRRLLGAGRRWALALSAAAPARRAAGRRSSRASPSSPARRRACGARPTGRAAGSGSWAARPGSRSRAWGRRGRSASTPPRSGWAATAGSTSRSDFGETWAPLSLVPGIRAVLLVALADRRSDRVRRDGRGPAALARRRADLRADRASRGRGAPPRSGRGPALVVACDRGVLVTKDEGRSFEGPGPGLPPGPVRAIALSSYFSVDPVMFAAPASGGVYRSSDGGRDVDGLRPRPARWSATSCGWGPSCTRPGRGASTAARTPGRAGRGSPRAPGGPSRLHVPAGAGRGRSRPSWRRTGASSAPRTPASTGRRRASPGRTCSRSPPSPPRSRWRRGSARR